MSELDLSVELRAKKLRRIVRAHKRWDIIFAMVGIAWMWERRTGSAPSSRTMASTLSRRSRCRGASRSTRRGSR